MTEPAANAGPPPAADPQDPLPESDFRWRRIFSYMVSCFLLALVGLVVWRMDTASELKHVAFYLTVLLWTTITYYMLAPSAEQVVKMLQTAKLFAQGITMRQTAVAENDKGRATSTVTVTPAAPTTPPKPRAEVPRSDFPDPPFGED